MTVSAPLELLLERAALSLLLDLPALDRPAEVEVARNGLRVRVVAAPADWRQPASAAIVIDPNRLTACEADALEVIRSAAPRRITREAVHRELERRGRLHGESTLGRALARLVRAGLLSNLGDRRGYGLPAASVRGSPIAGAGDEPEPSAAPTAEGR